MLVGLRHLIAGLRESGGIHPLIAHRSAVIIEMIIHSVAAGVLRSVNLVGKASRISEIIIAQKEDNVLELVPVAQSGNPGRAVIIILDLFIDREHPRNTRHVAFHVLSDQPVLRQDNIFKDIDVFRKSRVFPEKLRVLLASHSDRDDALEFAVSPYSFTPKSGDGIPVGNEAPGIVITVLAIYMLPFLSGPEQRLMMRCAHDHAVNVSQLSALDARSVLTEGRTPHRGPHIIAVKPQQKNEYLLVHLRREAAELLLAPAPERRPLVIDKEASVLYRRLLRDDPVGVPARTDLKRNIVSFNRPDVSPPYQRRYPGLLGHGKEAVDQTSFVASVNI